MFACALQSSGRHRQVLCQPGERRALLSSPIKAVTFLCQDTGAAAQKTDDCKLPDPGLITTFQNSDQEIALPPGLSKNTLETGLAKKKNDNILMRYGCLAVFQLDYYNNKP